MPARAGERRHAAAHIHHWLESGSKVNVIKGVVPIGAMRKMPFSWQRLHQHAAYADEGAGISTDSCPFPLFLPGSNPLV